MASAIIPNQLLEKACPSIQYRLQLEVLNQSGSDREMRALQSQILEDPAVQEFFGWQAADGWLAWNFHGYHSMEAGLRLLCEKEVDSCYPVLSKALQALRDCDEDRLERRSGQTGQDIRPFGIQVQGTLKVPCTWVAGESLVWFEKLEPDTIAG